MSLVADPEAIQAGLTRPRYTQSDEEVVARVRSGEKAAFETLMRRYNQRIYRVARSLLRDEAEAEDVMQQAYVNAYLHLDQFAGRSRFSTWLTRIAVHDALARSRRGARLRGIEAMVGDDVVTCDALLDRGPDPEQQAHTAQVRVLLEAAIDRLPPHYRMVFVLREAEGLDTQAVADYLDISVEAVRTRLCRARALLRQHLHETTGWVGSQAFTFHLSRCDRVVANVFARLQELEPRLRTAG